MLLRELLQAVPHRILQGSADTPVTALCYQTEKIRPGAAFVCLRGERLDAHTLALPACRAGAAVLVVETLPAETLPAGVTLVQTVNTRRALAAMSAVWFGYPARALTLIGVTGTKGKTTTACFLRSMLAAARIKAGYIGTLGVQYGDGIRPTVNTTPESYELHRLFSEMKGAGVTHVVMEVSSQAYRMYRVEGLQFACGIFTNLSPDHIGPGEHPDFADYLRCKAELFRHSAQAVVNADDPYTASVLRGAMCRITTYGLEPGAALGAKDLAPLHTAAMLGMRFSLCGPMAEPECRADVAGPGTFSVYNALAALAAARLFGVPQQDALRVLPGIRVPGRTELVPVPGPFTVLIDYAHNEASTETLLKTLRPYAKNRLVVVFGCGGNRPVMRRTAMGGCAARWADLAILTEDNSRYEAVESILADILAGYRAVRPAAVEGKDYLCIPDREEALRYAVRNAQPGDLVAVIGKGHETYREKNGVKTPFCEREILLKATR